MHFDLRERLFIAIFDSRLYAQMPSRIGILLKGAFKEESEEAQRKYKNV